MLCRQEPPEPGEISTKLLFTLIRRLYTEDCTERKSGQQTTKTKQQQQNNNNEPGEISTKLLFTLIRRLCTLKIAQEKNLDQKVTKTQGKKCIISIRCVFVNN